MQQYVIGKVISLATTCGTPGGTEKAAGSMSLLRWRCGHSFTSFLVDTCPVTMPSFSLLLRSNLSD